MMISVSIKRVIIAYGASGALTKLEDDRPAIPAITNHGALRLGVDQKGGCMFAQR
jgi:hypothetical protein